jgi:hypothetical protein
MSNFSPKPLSEDSFKNLIKTFEGTTQAKMEAKYDYVDETAVPFEKKPTNQMKITEFSINEEESLEEMANFFTVTREQQASINPEDYKGTKQLVAKAIKNDIKPGEHFTKATIQGIINKDPLKDFNFVVDSENIESQGKTSDVKPKEPKTTTGKKGRPSTGTSKPKETSTDTKASKIVARKTDSEDEPEGSDIIKASNDLDKELTGKDAIVQKFNQASEIIKKHKARVKSGEKSKEDLKATFQSYLLNQLKFPTSSQVYKDLMSIWTTEVK